MTKSICIATYNGSKFISEQMDSILSQIGSSDEIIIVDDCSSDNTLDIINAYNDTRITIYQNEKNLRHVKSFERAISLSKNELIYLCDQDDIWEKERLKLFENYFLKHPQVLLITSNFDCIDDKGESIINILQKVSTSDSFLYKKNIISIFTGKIGYYGCAMAFKRELISFILPIPDYTEAHDLWIALVSNYKKANLHIAEKTLFHRMHASNASDLNRKLYEKLISRMVFLKLYREIGKRIR